MGKKIAIVGTAPSSRNEAPFTDEAWDIWACSPVYDGQQFNPLPRITRFFELHDLDGPELSEGLAGVPAGVESYRRWLEGLPDKGIEVFTKPEWAAAWEPWKAYPIETITNTFGRYFTNTVSYMIAAAILHEPDAIYLYGVDMAQDTEYETQRPSCEYFLGYATALGIDVHVHPNSDLLKSRRLYGFESDGEFIVKIKARQEEFNERQNLHRQELDHYRAAISGLQAAITEHDDLRGLLNGDGSPELLEQMGSRRGVLERNLHEARHLAADADTKLKALVGAQEDLKWVRQWA